MFNWRAAIGCFSAVGIFVCAFLATSAFENGDEEICAAFTIAGMFLVFVLGGLVFA